MNDLCDLVEVHLRVYLLLPGSGMSMEGGVEVV